MATMLNTIIPLFIIIALGALFSKKILGETGYQVLNSFIYYLTFPVLIFFSLARTNIKTILNFPFIIAFVIGIVVTYVITFLTFKLLKQNLAEANMRATSAAFANTAYIGFPLVISLFGEHATLVPATITLCLPILIVIFAITLNEIATNVNATNALEKAFIPVITNPLFLAFFLGLLTALLEIKIPDALNKTGTMLGQATIPCALFVIGGSLAHKQTFRGNQNLVFITLMKLIFQPLITGILLVAFGVQPLWIVVGILCAASPTALLLPVLGQRYRVYEQGSSAIVLVTTIIYLLLLPVYLYVLKLFFPSI